MWEEEGVVGEKGRKILGQKEFDLEGQFLSLSLAEGSVCCRALTGGETSYIELGNFRISTGCSNATGGGRRGK